jgi:hypothetical protein
MVLSRLRTIRSRLTLRRVFAGSAALFALFLALGALVVWFESFDARFARSKPDLEAYAAQVMATPQSETIPKPPAFLGSFKTGDAERLPHGFQVFCFYGNPFDATGLAYSTEPLPTTVTVSTSEYNFYTHIEGNWYRFWRG